MWSDPTPRETDDVIRGDLRAGLGWVYSTSFSSEIGWRRGRAGVYTLISFFPDLGAALGVFAPGVCCVRALGAEGVLNTPLGFETTCDLPGLVLVGFGPGVAFVSEASTVLLDLVFDPAIVS